MRKIVSVFAITLCIGQTVMAQIKTVTIRVIQTSDVHGCFFPYDFVNRKPKEGSLARVSSYVNELRKQYGKNVILLDNGDILQGQPTCYYSNYIKPKDQNVAAAVVNYMKYDACTVGNHDIETGHAVYDKWINEIKSPVLGANVISTSTGKPYLKPYTVFERDGIKLAVIGMITPAIPNWLSSDLWSGLSFEDMVVSARKWVDYIKQNESPDIIIGLFHSGRTGGITTHTYSENESERVAREVPGFDIVLFGHDHIRYEGDVKNVNGDNVICLNPSNNALNVCDATVKVVKDGTKTLSKEVTGHTVNICDQPIDESFTSHFKPEIDSVNAYVNRVIGRFESSLYTRDCYFGSSAFTDFIHNMQLKLTKADVSFNAPLSFDECIPKGNVRISDMFNLYKYENKIYVLRMTGEEIRKHLEMSYDLWTNTITSPDEHIMQIESINDGGKKRYRFKNPSFNFDSAAGIDYVVDVTKPCGRKVKILRMSDGRPFDEHKWYRVAMNSYRGNGGGELLTKGAGIPLEEISKRIVWKSEHDQRFYLTQEIEKEHVLNPKANGNWKFVPELLASESMAKDRTLLFGK